VSTIRLTFDISPETHEKLTIIPHGLRKHVYKALIEQLAKELEADPQTIITSAVFGKLSATELLKKAEAEANNQTRSTPTIGRPKE